MFLSRNKKNNEHPCKHQFYYIKVGFKGVKIIKARLRDVKFFVYTSLVLNVAFALSLFVSHLSFFDSLASLCFVSLAFSGTFTYNFYF